jgi:hypothetical protein
VHRSKELKSGRKKVNPYHKTITYTDLLSAMQFAQAGDIQDDQAMLFYGSVEEATRYDEEEGNAYICELINEFAEKTSRGRISAYWPWPVEVVGFSSLTSDEEASSKLSEPGWNVTTIDSQVGSGRYVILTSGMYWR